MSDKAEIEQEIPPTEEPKKTTDIKPAKYVKCKSMTYSEDVLAKKRELALKALAVARKSREDRMRQLIEEENKLKELEAKKKTEAEPKPEKPKKEPKPKPEKPEKPKKEPKKPTGRGARPALATAETASAEDDDEPPKPKPKPKKPKQPVYEDSSDSDSDSDNEYVLTKKKTVKKLKALKQEHKNRHNYEVSEQALLRKWAEERHRMALQSLLPTHNF